ncbi:MAG: acyl carrier protein [Candidatus Rokubacteria bacterium]|nr:acyl carrier protein [Candidatus Rokubacteria bacterium]
MAPKEVLDELKTILVTRLKFDPRRAAEMSLETPLPKDVAGSAGLDSLDFIELSLAVEERFGIPMDDSQDLTEHFASLDTLCRYICARAGGA